MKYVALGIEANCVPMYMAELAPASIRGGLVNFYQSWLYVGGVLASATVYASTTHLDGKWAYMTRKWRTSPPSSPLNLLSGRQYLAVADMAETQQLSSKSLPQSSSSLRSGSSPSPLAGSSA